MRSSTKHKAAIKGGLLELDGGEGVNDILRKSSLLRRLALITIMGLSAIPSAQGMSEASALDVCKEAAVEGDYWEAFEHCKTAAEQGHVTAQYKLAEIYRSFNDLLDLEEAARWYKTAAEQGHRDSMFQLGIMYQFGYGVSQDSTASSRWLEAFAQVDTLQVCEEEISEKNFGQAIEHCTVAAENGALAAQIHLGTLYMHGQLGVAIDQQRAIYWFKHAAMQGDALSQWYVGWGYERGLGVVRDDIKAATWYRAAAEQGHAESQWDLARLYENGEGVTQHFVEAYKLYNAAAKSGLPGAQYDLGRVYKEGKGVDRDLVRAHMWFNLSASNDVPSARTMRDRIAKELTPEQIAEAQELARRCMASNYVDCE